MKKILQIAEMAGMRKMRKMIHRPRTDPALSLELELRHERSKYLRDSHELPELKQRREQGDTSAKPS